MKLYMHPVSTASRPLMLFIKDNNMDVEMQVVDLMAGEHYKDEFTAINPNRFVPVLESGDFRLTESSAILKYLAEKIDSPAYPKGLEERARVNESMDWFNTNFYREYGYHLIYPQLFDHHRRPEGAPQQATIEWGKTQAERFLTVLDTHWLANGKRYLCGGELSIADYFGSGILSLGELIGCSFERFPNVDRWYGTMLDRPNWAAVNEVFNGFAEQLKGKEFVKLC